MDSRSRRRVPGGGHHRRRSRSRWSAISLRPRCARSICRTRRRVSPGADVDLGVRLTRCTSAPGSGLTCARCTRMRRPDRSGGPAGGAQFGRRSGGTSTTRRRTRTAGCPTTTRTPSATSRRRRATRSGRSPPTRMIRWRPGAPVRDRELPARPDLGLLPGRDLVCPRLPSDRRIRMPVASRCEPGLAVPSAAITARSTTMWTCRTNGRTPPMGSSTSGARAPTTTSGRRTPA